MRTAIITFSTQGKMIGLKLKDNIPDSMLFVHESVPNARRTKRFKKVSELIGNIFNKVENIIYIGPIGIAVRSLCAHVRNKLSDPAVVVVDAGGRFAVSVLSGHEGGANALAISVANILGAEPVISTTTEAIKTITVGIGCRKGTKAEVIVRAVKKALTLAGVTIDNVKWLATAEIKRNEAGLKKASQMLNLPLRIIPNWLMQRGGDEVTESEFVRSRTGLPGVAEPAALTSGRNTRLILKRQIIDGITVAIAEENCLWSV